MLASFAVLSIFAVAMVSAAPGSDPFTGHCAKTCANVKQQKSTEFGVATKKRLLTRREASDVPPVFVDKIVRKYQTYAGCMNDCMCAAYCTVLEELADWQIESCAPVCRRAKPYTNGDKFFKEMENSLNTL